MIICKDEELYFYYVSLKTNFISFDNYENWLNNLFISDNTQNDFLFELQFCTGDIEKTIEALYIYLYDKLALLDYHEVAKMIIYELRKQCNERPDSLREIVNKLDEIWRLLPNEIIYEEPFIVFNSINDYWTYISEKQSMKTLNWLFNYYND